MTVRDSITRTGARTPGAEDDPTSKAAHDRVLNPTQCGITEATTTCAKGGHKPNTSRCMPGAGLSRPMCGKVLPYMPAFQPYRGKPAVRSDRGGRGNVGIIRSPVRASILPDRTWLFPSTFCEYRPEFIPQFDPGAIPAHDEALLNDRQRIIPSPVDDQ